MWHPPSLDITRSVWDYTKRGKQLKQPEATKELWKVLRDVWKNLPASNLEKIEKELMPFEKENLIFSIKATLIAHKN